MTFFFAGWPVAKVALIAGALLLVTRRVEPGDGSIARSTGPYW